MFQSCPADGAPAPAAGTAGSVTGSGQPIAAEIQIADLVAVFASRSDFASKMQPKKPVRPRSAHPRCWAVPKLICQQLPDQDLRRLLIDGTQLTCLFLDPRGDAIKAREREEEHPPGHLSTLTSLNIEVLSRLRDRLPAEAQERVRLGVYDETIRFNIVLVDDRTCVVQPYLPQARGIDPPTMLIRRNDAPGGLFPTFEQVYDSLQERSKQL